MSNKPYIRHDKNPERSFNLRRYRHFVKKRVCDHFNGYLGMLNPKTKIGKPKIGFFTIKFTYFGDGSQTDEQQIQNL